MTNIVGILNITPDSCSDGGLYNSFEAAMKHAKQMLEDGASLIDIGGESTRPGAEPVHPDIELARVLPVVKALVSQGVKNLSIDTRNASTAKACLKAGVSMINDVSALTHDPEMIHVVKDAEKIVLMHMRGLPKTMQQEVISYHDVVKDIKSYLKQRIEFCVSHGIKREKICIDPGLGFGKTTAHCVEILSRLDEFKSLGSVFVGPSRKNFIGELTGIHEYSPERDYGTLAAVIQSAQQGADWVRVHNVKAAVDALKVWKALSRSAATESC